MSVGATTQDCNRMNNKAYNRDNKANVLTYIHVYIHRRLCIDRTWMTQATASNLKIRLTIVTLFRWVTSSSIVSLKHWGIPIPLPEVSSCLPWGTHRGSGLISRRPSAKAFQRNAQADFAALRYGSGFNHWVLIVRLGYHPWVPHKRSLLPRAD